MTGLARYTLPLSIACVLIAVAPLPAAAQSSQPSTQSGDEARAALREKLFDALKHADTEREARRIENEIWMFWTQGPDAEATRQISEIFAARSAYDLEKALRIANALTERLADYAEGWNQKATVLFLQGKLDQSLEAVARVLKLEPKHFGALSGKALILMRQGRVELAQEALRKAVEIHPFLKERHLLVEPPGRRI
jgi:tetratricopeptide (TPR) repeat protein